jgi:hypothetical protein
VALLGGLPVAVWLNMQRRLAALDAKWRAAGIEQPFPRPHGHQHRVLQRREFRQRRPHGLYDIGAEANLAARLQSIAEPGHIVVSYETYALVRDLVAGRKLPPISVKGISREVIPYAIEGMLDAAGRPTRIFSEHLTGLDLDLDPSLVATHDAERVRAALKDALAALEARKPAAA